RLQNGRRPPKSEFARSCSRAALNASWVLPALEGSKIFKLPTSRCFSIYLRFDLRSVLFGGEFGGSPVRSGSAGLSHGMVKRIQPEAIWLGRIAGVFVAYEASQRL